MSQGRPAVQQQSFLTSEAAIDATLHGVVQRVTYYNEENHYAVIRLWPNEDSQTPQDAQNQEGLVTVTGYIVGASEGLTLRCSGRWVMNPKYGRQFECAHYQSQLPGDIDGTKVYLQQVKGIGPVSAERIIRHFGEEQLAHIMRADPERLLEFSGIQEEVLQRLVALLRETTHQDRETQEFLFSLGISPAIARRIGNTYGAETLARVKANPYMLAQEVYGIGFLRADQIARQMGVPVHSPYRIRANLSHQLEQAVFEGHTYLPAEQLCQRAVELLAEVELPAVAQELEHSLEAHELWEERFQRGRHSERAIYLPQYHEAERTCARRLRLLTAAESALQEPWSEAEWQQALIDVHTRRETPLSREQLAALRALHRHKISILTGGPGTGKTETLRTLVSILRERPAVRYSLAAPTGRAAKRMEESTGAKASTIHRLLSFGYEQGRWRPRFHEDHPLESDVVVIDETSMMDIQLFSMLLKAIKPAAHLLLLGDVDQLPSVGAGRVLQDCIEAGLFRVTRLTKIFRQEADSAIITNAHRVVRGQLPQIQRNHQDFFLFPAQEAEQAANLLVEVVCERLSRRFPNYDPLHDVQVMAPMREGLAGVRNLNRLLQQRLNPPGPAEVKIGMTIFRVRDRLMQTRNNYDKEVYNGDIGFIQAVDPETRHLVVRFDQRDIEYKPDEVDQLTPAYCITIHKSQGSEYPVVVMAFLMQHYVMLQRNLLYTAITRAREKVIIVGNRAALARAVKNNRVVERYSGLLSRLRGEVQGALGSSRAPGRKKRSLSEFVARSGIILDEEEESQVPGRRGEA
ncbi:MAG: ATP-dependent RecD-like DNA helicase [Chloroflexi bacterium]|nr:ATP-dependent RecD-like DNA helicase [Chloroflexota bacterium]